MKWFFVTSDPWPMHHGTALRVYHLALKLSKTVDVEIITDWTGEGAESAYKAIGVPLSKADQQKKNAHFNRYGPYPYNEALHQLIHNKIKDDCILLLFSAKMLQYALAGSKKAVVIADMIDEPVLAAKRRLLTAGSIKWAYRNLRLIWELKRYEKFFLDYVDLFTFVTPVDSRSFSKRNSDACVKTISNGVSVSHWDNFSADHLRLTDKRPYVVFVGNYTFVPNYKAAQYLVKKIAPIVWQSSPDVHFKFVGGNPPDWLKDNPDDRIEALGFVDDVRPFVQDAKMVAIPMTTGTGIKNKLLEAWAACKPVVATPLACQGIPVEDNVNILIGKKPAEIASGICRLWQDDKLCREIAEKGREVIETRFSWEIAAEKLINSVNSLMIKKKN